jgi:hypothetical protein
VERKRKVPGPNGQLVDGTEIGFRASGEHWNEYLLDDGAVVRLKLVVTEVIRLDDVFDDDGNPGYVTKATTVTSVSAPENMRKQP